MTVPQPCFQQGEWVVACWTFGCWFVIFLFIHCTGYKPHTGSGIRVAWPAPDVGARRTPDGAGRRAGKRRAKVRDGTVLYGRAIDRMIPAEPGGYIVYCVQEGDNTVPAVKPSTT